MIALCVSSLLHTVHSDNSERLCTKKVIPLRNVEDVEAFRLKNCTRVPNMLQIQGEVNTLTGLEHVESIGQLEIVKTEFLKNLAGLQNIRKVKDLRIVQNSQLATLAGLGGLLRVDNHVVIQSNEALAELTGLDSVEFVGGSLTIRHNVRLRTLTGLGSLRAARNLALEGNSELVSLRGVQALSEVNSTLRIVGHNYLRSLHGLKKLIVVKKVVVDGNKELFTLSGLHVRHAQKIEITNNTNLYSLGAFGKPVYAWSIKIDEASLPTCITPREVVALRSMARETSLPEVGWERWQKNRCGPQPAFCTQTAECKVNLGEMPETYDFKQVCLSRSNGACGGCGIKKSGSLGWGLLSSSKVATFDFRYTTLGDYSICGSKQGTYGDLHLPLTDIHIGTNQRVTIGQEFRVSSPGLLGSAGDTVRILHRCAARNDMFQIKASFCIGHRGDGGGAICQFEPQYLADGSILGRFRKCRCSKMECKIQSDYDTDIGRITFVVEWEHLGLYIFCLSSATFLTASNLRQPTRIDDISVEHDRTLVSTLGYSWWFKTWRPFRSFKLRLRGTEHTLLNGTDFRAQTVGANLLELSYVDGAAISERLDTSRGTLELRFPQEFLLTGFGLPFGVWILGLLALAHRSAQKGKFGQLISSVGGALSIAIGLCSAVITRTMFAKRKTTLQKYIHKFQINLPEYPTLRCKGPGRAITLGKLLNLHHFFENLIRDRTAYYLDGNITKPLCQALQVSYSELVGAVDVEWFVSHYWGTAFTHFCDSLEKHSESVTNNHRELTETAYWICFLSNNQHDIETEIGRHWNQSSFYLALTSSHCKGTCMVLDELAKPLTRAWCIFEVVHTFLLQQSNADYQGLLFCTSTGVLNFGQGSIEVAMNLARRIATLNLAQAEATAHDDAVMIRDAVKSLLGSYEKMHNLVHGRVHEVLVTANKHASEEFLSIFEMLQDDSAPRAARAALAVAEQRNRARTRTDWVTVTRERTCSSPRKARKWWVDGRMPPQAGAEAMVMTATEMELTSENVTMRAARRHGRITQW